MEKNKICCPPGAYVLQGGKQNKHERYTKCLKDKMGQGDRKFLKGVASYERHKVTFEQNPESEGASPMKPGREKCKKQRLCLLGC